MKIKGNKLIAVASLCAILVFPGNSHASGLIEDVKERYDIASGVQYVEIDRFTESGFIDIDILKQLLIEKFTQINYTEAKEDVLPFIKNNNSLTLWNSDFFIIITNDLKGVS